jgi:two-component system, NtrC family, sensor kinase
MPEIEKQFEQDNDVAANGPAAWTWGRFRHSLSAKLIAMLVAAMAVTFALLGYLNIRLHRGHLETATLMAAERVSDTLRRTTSYEMLRNDREALYEIINTTADEPEIVSIRIINQEGTISFSSNTNEVGSHVQMATQACNGCHAGQKPLAHLERNDRFRIYRTNTGRVLGIITPIENRPECSNAACHAHPPEQKILGVLDTNLSLQRTDAGLAQSTRRMLAYTGVGILVVAFLTGAFVWRYLGKPVREIRSGTERLTAGELGYQIKVHSEDELGELATSFNSMSLQLEKANEEITAWARTLEERVDEKTAELKRVHEHMLHTEKLTSLGKLAAVVAHEINNPLSGILTYAKLLKKWLDRTSVEEPRKTEMADCLNLIESESKRCGELVKSLLTFSRNAPLNIQRFDINAVVERCVRLVKPKAEISGVELQCTLDSGLPLVQCDPAQIEQVLLALVMNAFDAMPRGGNVWLKTSFNADENTVALQVRDDGTGIPDELLPRMFEPFFTTKGSKGVGLGLAISRNIVDRHNGKIEVQSKAGQGTTFTISIPVDAQRASTSAPVPTTSAVSR